MTPSGDHLGSHLLDGGVDGCDSFDFVDNFANSCRAKKLFVGLDVHLEIL